MDYVQKALKIYEEIKNKPGVFKCYDNIGSIYSYEGNYTKAIEFYNHALKVSEQLTQNQRQSSVTILENNIGYAYMKLGDYSNALDNFNNALKLNENNEDKFNKLYLFDNIANTYLELKNYKEALEYALQSSKSAKELKELNIENNGYRILKEIYKIKGDYRKATEYSELYKKDWEQPV